MHIREARIEDLERIMEIYAFARRFMADTGNPKQWADRYPEKDLLVADIEKQQLFVMEEGGLTHGVFAFIIGEDPTYDIIEDGAWLDDVPYGTIHRIAGDGQVKGLLQACVIYCNDQIDNLRIDTHHDNKIMQHAIEKNGFKRCGVIYSVDGSSRIAYQRH